MLRSRQNLMSKSTMNSFKISEKNKRFVRGSTNISERNPVQIEHQRHNLLGRRSGTSVPVRSRPNTSGQLMRVRHGSTANIEGVSTDDVLTAGLNRKSSVTGITTSHTKFQGNRSQLPRPQTAKYVSRPKSSDADSFGKPQEQSKSPGK